MTPPTGRPTSYGYGMGGYEMMGSYWVQPLEMPITSDQALKIAQSHLDVYSPPGAVADHVHTFYGYYTITVSVGELYGMLSVNGYNGQVWHHTWHGSFIQRIKIQAIQPTPQNPPTFFESEGW